MEISTVIKPPDQSTQAAKRTELARQTRNQDVQAKPPESNQPAQAKASQPVVNTQGQTTGRLLNVTA